MISLEGYLEEKKALVDRALNACLPVAAPKLLLAALRYCLEAGGKRLRPLLLLTTAEALGASDEEVIELACAVELIHTYSLIHDDLPAMDDSALRRGLPTCHMVYGEAAAVLAGDAFLTLGFEMVARYGLKEGRAERAATCAHLLARASGAGGMVGGQMLDLLAEGRKLKVLQVEKIAALKTGALITSAVEMGAVAAGADSAQRARLVEYASALGRAFQIADDLLDYQNDSQLTGKPVGLDQEQNKATYPALFGLKQAEEKIKALYEQATRALNELGCPTELLAALAKRLVFRLK